MMKYLKELVKDKNIDAVAVFTEGPNHGKHVLCTAPAVWGSGNVVY